MATPNFATLLGSPEQDDPNQQKPQGQTDMFAALGQPGGGGQAGGQAGGQSPFGGLGQPAVQPQTPAAGGPSPGALAQPGVMPQQPGGVTPLPGVAPNAQQPGQANAFAPEAPDQQGINQFQTWAKQMFGRNATPQELQQIAQSIGYQGGAITPEQMQAAQKTAQDMAVSQGWTPGQGGTPTPPDLKISLQDRLRQMLTQPGSDVDLNSQEFQMQRNAFRGANQRAMERAKNAAAERAAGSGTLGAGGFEAGMQGLDLAGAQAEGQFEAGLAERAVGRQREDVQNAIQALMQQQGIDLQGELGRGDLDLRRLLGLGQLDLGREQLGLGRDQLGFNYWNALQNYQNQAVNRLLG